MPPAAPKAAQARPREIQSAGFFSECAPQVFADTYQDGVHYIRHEVEDETEKHAQRQGEHSTQQCFLRGALDHAFGDTEAKTHQGEDDGNNPEVPPAVSTSRNAVDEAGLSNGPAGKCSEQP